MLFARLICCCLLLLPLHGVANELLKPLSQSAQWRALLMYDPSSSGGQSHLRDDSFFLSSNGANSPHAELVSFYEAVGVATETGQWTSVCQFPARLLWLSDALGLGLHVEQCEAFQNWPERTSTQSLSLLYAAGYLGNPASFFGHSFIKLNTDAQTVSEAGLLDTSINYGAKVPDDEDPFTYLFKGVTGGYEGSFTDAKYYVQTLAYGEMEQRDIWEYRLALTDRQRLLILAHIWEIKDRPFTYYFFRENCAYRIMQLLGVEPQFSETIPAVGIVLPQETMRGVVASGLQQTGLVRDIVFHPSRQRRSFALFSQLSKASQEHVRLLLADLAFARAQLAQTMSHMSDIEKTHVIDFLLEYLPTLSVEETASYNSVLAYRFQLPPSSIRDAHVVSQRAPHQAVKPTHLGLGVIYDEDLGVGQSITLRPLLYDRLDASQSAGPDGEVVAGVVELQHFDSRSGISQLDLFRVQSVAESAVGVEQDQANVWSLAVGFKSRDSQCLNCLSGYLEVEKGKLFRPFGLAVAALGTAEFHDGEGAWLGLGLEGVIDSADREGRFLWQLPLRKSLNSRDYEWAPRIAYRQALAKDWDLRLSYEPKHPSAQFAVSVGVYF